MTETTRRLALEGSLNIRELGGHRTLSGQRVRPQRLLRGDSLHRLTPEAQQQLLEYGLTTVLDLRQPDELQQAPSVFAQHGRVTYLNLPLFAALAPEQLGQGNQDLPALYCLTLDHCHAAIRRALTEIERADGTVLFHCAVGKDRTGLLAALLLGALGVSEQDIIADYAVSARNLEPQFAPLLAQAAARGEDLQHLQHISRSDPEFMEHTLEHLRRTYGGIEGYYHFLGLDAGFITSLRSRFLEADGGQDTPAAARVPEEIPQETAPLG
ncbi:protein-tyrosine phosphatase [Deinobacterium chartae]|uniref:Protein-tyrosine phosphatase n=1 Tax=Deinobacterium chartae TaxID=521158 RepID=A0A841I7D9_9DEIO|nr:tyrosine-protein phosphatase [Deinobacterium chartae]MBB6100129.1 protein-tyrosine phosphatase [Deinobacterium chartae]